MSEELGLLVYMLKPRRVIYNGGSEITQPHIG